MRAARHLRRGEPSSRCSLRNERCAELLQSCKSLSALCCYALLSNVRLRLCNSIVYTSRTHCATDSQKSQKKKNILCVEILNKKMLQNVMKFKFTAQREFYHFVIHVIAN